MLAGPELTKVVIIVCLLSLDNVHGASFLGVAMRLYGAGFLVISIQYLVMSVSVGRENLKLRMRLLENSSSTISASSCPIQFRGPANEH